MSVWMCIFLCISQQTNVHVEFLFCLYPIIRRIFSVNFLKLSPWQTRWLYQVCEKNVILTKINPYNRWPHIIQRKGDLVPRCGHQLVVLKDPIPTKSRWCGHSGPGLAGQRVYLRCRSRMLHKASSHMWGSWYLPMFLLRFGSLTLINMASLMVLLMVCDSLSTVEKLCSLVWCPEATGMDIDGGGCSEMFLQPLPKVLADPEKSSNIQVQVQQAGMWGRST